MQQAERIYRQILKANPSHAQALHMLGVVALQSGQHEAAIGLIANAVRLDGNNAALHVNLGEAYRGAGKLDEARACYARAGQLDPRLPQPHLFLGILQTDVGDLQAAADSFHRAILLQGDLADAHFALGNILRKLGKRDLARACYERAVQSNPDFFEALVNLGTVSREAGLGDRARECLERAIRLRPDAAEGPFYLGNLEAERQDWTAAIEWYEKATRLNPNMASAEARLGSALQAHGQTEAAIAHYRRALQLQPSLAEAHYNLGTALADQGHIGHALEEYELAIQYDPDFIDAHINLGAYYQDKGEEGRALVHINRALEIDPTAAEPRFNRALILLSRGDLAAGWKDFQARLQLPKFPVRARPEPLWDGAPIPGKTLLVHCEQGLGDTFQFIRYVSRIKQRCARVVLHVQTPLIPLLRQSGFDQLFGNDDPLPAVDYHAPMMSLPAAWGTTLETIFADVPYLSVSREAIAGWQNRLSGISPVRVGIAWKGSPAHISDHARSIPLAEFAPLARIPGVTLVSLQKREGVEQLRDVDFGVHQLEGDWDDTAGPFVDTAAVMKNLDLVITADTAAAHLAGALGVPVWVALWARPDWRWLRDRQDTPWYPTMRLFRQSQEGDWAEVFARVAAELERYASAMLSSH